MPSDTLSCPYPGCRSRDVMASFRKPRRIFLLSRLIPRLRRWLCRACGRRFWWLKPRTRGPADVTEGVPELEEPPGSAGPA